MSRRANSHLRCPTCRLHQPLCICARLGGATYPTRVELLIHYREERKPTNTGRLAVTCLTNSRMQIIGRPGVTPNLEYSDNERPLLLFPAQEAVDLAEMAQTIRPDERAVLIVPDGNWRQAAKMRKRVPGLLNVPCVQLPSGQSSSYRLRREPKEDGLATLEAIVQALDTLHPTLTASTESLRRVFTMFVERTLWTRGQLRADQVTGGIPREALQVAGYRDGAADRDAVGE